MDKLTQALKNPDIAFWPEVRWWLAEGFHTDETLRREVRVLHEAGFGAAEFLAMDEGGADSSRYGWGSEEWVHDSKVVIDETTARGMGASFTSGTNWSNANLITIVPDDRAASKELDFTVETVPAGQTRSGAIRKCALHMPNVNEQTLVAVVAVRLAGERDGRILLAHGSHQVLTDRVVGSTLCRGSGEDDAPTLDWTAPTDGDHALFAFWMHGTGQTASPSAGISYTVNYIDRYGIDALTAYWDEVVLTPELAARIRENGRVQMYMDSLELSAHGRGGTYWGYHFLEEFRSRRGYDPTTLLPFAMKDAVGMLAMLQPSRYYYDTEDALVSERFRNDLHQTMTEMYCENMLEPMRAWLHRVGMTLRAEISYGLPFEITIPGKHVDGIETESLEFASQIEAYRHLAGPAHLYGKTYSSETGATLMNYMCGLDFYNQIIFTQFAAGVSRTVLHGHSSIAGSDASTQWPGHEGMWPMFSERFGERQPAFRHYGDWTSMLARFQMLIRAGRPRMDLGILRLDYTFNNVYFSNNEKELYETKLMRANEGVYWKDMTLQNAGYTYDYFAPQILEDEEIRFADGVVAPDGPAYQALLIYQTYMPVTSARRILAWAKQGMKVVLVNGATEMVRPEEYKTHARAASLSPFLDGSDAELLDIRAELLRLPGVREVDDPARTREALLSLGVAPRAAFGAPCKKVLTHMRETDEAIILYLYHYMYTEQEAFPFTVSIDAADAAGAAWQADCWSGERTRLPFERTADGRTKIALTLCPGEATVIVLDREDKKAGKNDCETAGMTFPANGAGSDVLSSEASGVSPATPPFTLPLEDWSLEVEDWNEGEKHVIREDRGLGYITEEVWYDTKKTRIAVGRTELKPWKDIPAVGREVSGVGFYTTCATLPADGTDFAGMKLKIGSTCGLSAAVLVNGRKAPAVNLNARTVEIGALLQPGENTIVVEIASTLNNRLKARGYYERIKNIVSELQGKDECIPSDWLDYGMIGPVLLTNG